MTLALAIWLPLAAPLVGAALLALPVVSRGGRDRWEPIVIVTLVLTALGLGCAVVSWPVVGQTVRYAVSLGPLDPRAPAAGVAWSLAPAALGGVFLLVGLRARDRLLVRVAGLLVALATITAVRELADAGSLAGGSLADGRARSPWIRCR